MLSIVGEWEQAFCVRFPNNMYKSNNDVCSELRLDDNVSLVT